MWLKGCFVLPKKYGGQVCMKTLVCVSRPRRPSSQSLEEVKLETQELPGEGCFRIGFHALREESQKAQSGRKRLWSQE